MTSIADYPIKVQFRPSERASRGRVFFAFFLAFPLLIISVALSYLILVVWVLSFLAILINGTIPAWFLDVTATYLRYQCRALSTALFLRDKYPRLGFSVQCPDPDNDPFVYVNVDADRKRSRLRALIFVRLILLVPHLIAGLGVQLMVTILSILGWVIAVFIQRWPKFMQTWLIALIAYQIRVAGYFLFATDVYPPFAIADWKAS